MYSRVWYRAVAPLVHQAGAASAGAAGQDEVARALVKQKDLSNIDSKTIVYATLLCEDPRDPVSLRIAGCDFRRGRPIEKRVMEAGVQKPQHLWRNSVKNNSGKADFPPPRQEWDREILDSSLQSPGLSRLLSLWLGPRGDGTDSLRDQRHGGRDAY